MLTFQLRKPTGKPVPRDVWAFAYATLTWMTLDGRAELVMSFATHTVTIKGRNLDRLFERLAQFRVAVVEETDDAGDGESSSDAAVVTGVEVEPVTRG